MKSRNHRPRNRRERAARTRALDALSLMRRDKLSLTSAAKAAKTDPDTVHKYARSALERNGSRGKYKAKAFDRIPRTVNFPQPERSVAVTVNSSRTASLIGQYKNALRNYFGDPQESMLDPFRGKTFRAGGKTYEFITDPALTAEIGKSGFRAEGLYRAVQGEAA